MSDDHGQMSGASRAPRFPDLSRFSPMPSFIDFGAVLQVGLRAPLLDMGTDRWPCTFWSCMDELAVHNSVNRPALLGQVLLRCKKADPEVGRIVVESGIAAQLRAEIDGRRCGTIEATAPIASTPRVAPSHG